jgi:hypothetical protein
MCMKISSGLPERTNISITHSKFWIKPKTSSLIFYSTKNITFILIKLEIISFKYSQQQKIYLKYCVLINFSKSVLPNYYIFQPFWILNETLSHCQDGWVIRKFIKFTWKKTDFTSILNLRAIFSFYFKTFF